MKYFLVEVDEQYMAPTLLGWFGVIDKKTLAGKGPHQIGRHLLFPVESNMQMIFTDMITFPCFMVSEMMKDTIGQYDPSVQFARVILCDRERKQSMAYYLPFLEQVGIRGKMTEIGTGILSCTCVEGNIISDQVLIELTDQEKYYLTVRMDLLESILRRGAVGLGIKEIQIMHEGD